VFRSFNALADPLIDRSMSETKCCCAADDELDWRVIAVAASALAAVLRRLHFAIYCNEQSRIAANKIFTEISGKLPQALGTALAVVEGRKGDTVRGTVDASVQLMQVRHLSVGSRAMSLA
jgi:hypothetical protein